MNPSLSKSNMSATASSSKRVDGKSKTIKINQLFFSMSLLFLALKIKFNRVQTIIVKKGGQCSCLLNITFIVK